MIPNRIFFEIVFPIMPEPLVDAWDTLVSFLQSERCAPKTWRLSEIAGHREELQKESFFRVATADVRSIIVERDLTAFNIIAGRGGRELHLRLFGGRNEGEGVSFTGIINNSVKAPEAWNRLIEGMLVQWPGVGAWQWRSLYEIWQNHCLVNYYEDWFGPIPSKTRVYAKPSIDGVGPSRQMVDCSTNPGRSRILLPGAYFHPSAEMWLGPYFWEQATCTKEEVLAAEFFIERRDTPHFLYLKSWPEPFSRPDGEQGRIQQKLWRLLFHEDCEWPPGSGGISDEAVYGPLELLPSGEK